VDLCALTETLIIDADGIYDPKVLNDRLLLGLKGTMRPASADGRGCHCKHPQLKHFRSRPFVSSFGSELDCNYQL